MNARVVWEIVFVFAVAFVLNLAWENAHSLLYANYQGGPITQWVLLHATLFDAAYIALASFLFLHTRIFHKDLRMVFLTGVLVAVCIEYWALYTGRWEYNALMPIVPFLQVGVSPVLQLGLLNVLSLVLYRACKRQ